MSISAINCSPIKPQVSFGSASGVDEANTVLQLSRELNDSFKKGDNPEIKSPVQTTAAVIGAGLTMFALGKGAAKGITKVVKAIPKDAVSGIIPEFVKKDAVKVANDVANTVKDKLNKLPKGKVYNVLDSTVGNTGRYIKRVATEVINKNGLEKTLANASGLVAATTLAPAIVSADANDNGIADIAEKNINAYSSAVSQAEKIATMVSILA